LRTHYTLPAEISQAWGVYGVPQKTALALYEPENMDDLYWKYIFSINYPTLFLQIVFYNCSIIPPEQARIRAISR
jgi:hypothetical protein